MRIGSQSIFPLTGHQTPEDRELEAKRAALSALESELASREEQLATLRATLDAFQKKYLSIVGTRYAELDEILAQIAEVEARLNPKSKPAAQRAAAVRAKARESAEATAEVRVAAPPIAFQPSQSLKDLYRQAAKMLHPDLADSDEDRARRHTIMALANKAYDAGDEERLRTIMREWQASPESVIGEGAGADLVRIIRKIARIEDRLRVINGEILQIESTEQFLLKVRCDQYANLGRDLLDETAARILSEIAEARRRLSRLENEASR